MVFLPRFEPSTCQIGVLSVTTMLTRSEGWGLALVASPQRPDRVWGSLKSPVHWVQGGGGEAELSYPPPAEVNMNGATSPLPHTPSWRDV
jgi:hypothetical protein